MAINIHDSTGINSTLEQRLERKFYIPPQKTGVALGILRTVSRPDTNYPFEQINSLYFDSYDLDQHERSLSGEYKKDKVRLRWYGEAEQCGGQLTAFLELKSRQGFASTKQRMKLEIPAEDLRNADMLASIISKPMLIETLAGFGYFPLKELLPIIKISYRRYRFTEVLTRQSMALDCHIQGTAVAPHLYSGSQKVEIPGAVIEIKGQALEIPPLLTNLKLLEIDWSRFSKYSGCIEAYRENMASRINLSPSGLNFKSIPVSLGNPGSENNCRTACGQPLGSLQNEQSVISNN
jgi:hypothetical protein